MRAHEDVVGFQVAVRVDDGLLSLTCSGELDMGTTSVLRREVAGVTSDVMLDFSSVTFCDSSGIAVLLALATRLEGEGHHLRVTGVQPQVMRVFTITGVADLLSDPTSCAAAADERASPQLGRTSRRRDATRT